MELPKLVYDDFYKFLMSLGIILFVISLGLGISLTNNLILNQQWLFIILSISIFILSIILVVCAGRKWYKNQQLLDRKLKAETQQVEQSIELIVKPKKEITESQKGIMEDVVQIKDSVALVSYKVAQHFPDLNTIPFDLLRDWKIWFLIRNYEMKKYKAYIKIKFITSDGYEEDAGGHYSETVAWRLNAFSVIIAPGLGIPEEIKERVGQGKGIKIRILGKIKDENDNLVEEKLPVEYIYDSKNNSWYYEP